MSIYYYLSMIPEALLASMLEPTPLGAYLAVGTRKRSRGQAMFFSLKNVENLPFDLSHVEEACVAHPDGEPKHSLYIAIYRAMERVPMENIANLYMVTPDGRVLERTPGEHQTTSEQLYHLYQEISPVHTRIVSTLGPKRFTEYITDSSHAIYVPKVCFAELQLGELAEDPEHGSAGDLPYHAIDHLRDCLIQLRDNPGKHTKTVDRTHPQCFPYRTVVGGVYLGSGSDLSFYAFPTADELKSTYYEWWRSASMMSDVTHAM